LQVRPNQNLEIVTTSLAADKTMTVLPMHNNTTATKTFAFV